MEIMYYLCHAMNDILKNIDQKTNYTTPLINKGYGKAEAIKAIISPINIEKSQA